MVCNQGGTVFLFLSRLACHILNIADKDCATFIQAYICTHHNVEASYVLWGWLVPKCDLLPCIGHMVFHFWGHLEMDVLVSSYINEFHRYYILGNPLHLGAVGSNTSKHPWTYQVSYAFPSSALVPLVLSTFVAEHVRGQFRL